MNIRAGHTIYCMATKQFYFVRSLQRGGALRVHTLSGSFGNKSDTTLDDTRMLRFGAVVPVVTEKEKLAPETRVAGRTLSGRLVRGVVIRHGWSSGSIWVVWDRDQEVDPGPVTLKKLTPLEQLALEAE